jgi:hypothetical protein
MVNFVNSQNYSHADVTTPSDTTEQAGAAIYVGGAGNVSLLTEGGDTVTFTAPPVGSIIPMRFTRVRATGTTATLLIRMW